MDSKRRGKERGSGKAQKEFWEVGRATAKDTRAQEKTCGHLLHQRGEGGQKNKERDYISGERMRVWILLWGFQQQVDSFLLNISVVPARLPIETRNPFDILTEGTDDDDTVDESIPSVSEVEWPALTNSHHRCGERTWPKGSHKRKTTFVRFREDPCDLVNGEAKNLNFLGSHDCSDINHIDDS